MHYVARINSFMDAQHTTTSEAIRRIGAAGIADCVDINYPEHFECDSEEAIRNALTANHLKLHAMNMRFKHPFLRGVYTNPSERLRNEAVEMTQKAAEICKRLGGRLVIIWLSFDGYDYSFQMDYEASWQLLVDAFRAVCTDETLQYAIEYKPYEERGYALLDTFGTTCSLIRDTGLKNLGVVIDFCHMLMKKENPAFAASYLLSKGLLYGVHLNDGEGWTDNGLMVGMSNPWKTLELLYYLKRAGYDATIYFDTFPIREDAEKEFAANRSMFERMWKLLDEKAMAAIQEAMKAQDAMMVNRVFQSVLSGGS